MNAGGWIFMSLSLIAVWSLAIWCYAQVLRKPKGGRLVVKDGPFAESKEIVGGFYLIKADDYAHAVKLCEDHPQFVNDGFVEIREVDFMGEPETE